MALFVQKFGGTSVGDIERIERVADKVADFRANGHDLVVVVRWLDRDELGELLRQVVGAIG